MLTLNRVFIRITLALFLACNAFAAESKINATDFSLKADLLEIKNPSNSLFQFEKKLNKSGLDHITTRRFNDPSGKLIAEEKLNYKNGVLEKLELDHKQIGQSGSLTINGKKLLFSYSKDGKTKTAEENLSGTLVSTDEIYDYIQKNWDKLMAGETISIRLPVLDRLETVGFKFFKEKDADVDGVKATVVKMKPSSFVIAALVSPVIFYFHPTEVRPEGRKCIQVVGRTVPKRKDGDKWKDLDVIMKFKY
jgi:hypothetical protein